MAFQLRNQTPTYKWPVVVEPPVDGGQFGKETFDAEFRRLPQDQLREIGERIDNGAIRDDELCRLVLVGWAGIDDAEGEPVPFSEGNMEMMLNVALVASSIVAAWLDSLAKGKRKN